MQPPCRQRHDMSAVTALMALHEAHCRARSGHRQHNSVATQQARPLGAVRACTTAASASASARRRPAASHSGGSDAKPAAPATLRVAPSSSAAAAKRALPSVLAWGAGRSMTSLLGASTDAGMVPYCQRLNGQPRLSSHPTRCSCALLMCIGRHSCEAAPPLQPPPALPPLGWPAESGSDPPAASRARALPLQRATSRIGTRPAERMAYSG